MDWNVIAASMATDAIAAAEKTKQEFIADGADEREAGLDLIRVPAIFCARFCADLAQGDEQRRKWLLRETAAAVLYFANKSPENREK